MDSILAISKILKTLVVLVPRLPEVRGVIFETPINTQLQLLLPGCVYLTWVYVGTVKRHCSTHTDTWEQ